MASSPTAGPPGQPARRPDDEQASGAGFQRAIARINRNVAGWVLVAFGLLAIFLGWFGVSGQALVAKQLPYLVSGGIFGVALISLGAFILGTEDIRRDSGRLDRLERMVHQLHAVLLARDDAPDRALLETLDLTTGNGAGHGARSSAPDEDALVALPEAGTYHRATCAMVAGKANASALTPVAARRRGLKPCRLCEPAPVAS